MFDLDLEGVWGFLGAIVVFLIIVVSIGFVIIAPYYEAKSFNDCTGGRATYWTAVFTELRVQDCK